MEPLFSEEPTRQLINNGKLKGKAKAVFNCLRMLQNTCPMETDPEWWQTRADFIALDVDQQAGELPMIIRLMHREN